MSTQPSLSSAMPSPILPTALSCPSPTSLPVSADAVMGADAPHGAASAGSVETPNGVLVRWQRGMSYADRFDAMQAFTAARTADTPDELWLVEHPPVYTLGQAGNPAHLLADSRGIPLVRTDRGGQITYHGPGQVVAYMLIDLRRRGLMVKEFVQRIEQAAIETLAAYNLAGERHSGAPGIYLAEGVLGGAKIAALGLKIRHGCSYHGVSLNVQMDLSPFDDINPCGYAGLKTVDMAMAGVTAAWDDVAAKLAARLIANLPAMSDSHAKER